MSRHPTSAPSSRGPRFAQGDIVGKRYRVIRFIARGGMGEVYEAEDLELQVHIALKSIASERAEDAPALERFKREIQLARKITHPNICRIFDVGYDEKGVAFLTMELLGGETLAERIRRAGPMTPSEALPILEQMAAALDAAHAASVIHRDFKSHNVMLTGERVVVTDFGMARPIEMDSALTAEGAMVGSPAYMAPEQVQSQALSPATDVYALGVVLYEMVTGELPFTAETALATAAKRLTEPPPPMKGVDPKWQRVILRCLALRPEDRYARAAEVMSALGARARRRMMVPAVALAIAAVAGGVVLARRQKPHRAAPRLGVAVKALENRSHDAQSAWIATGLAELLSSELSVDGQVRAVSGEAVAQGATADVIVAGSYTTSPAGIRAELTLSGKMSQTLADEDPDVFRLADRLGQKLRKTLALAPPDASNVVAARAALPQSAEAARSYAEAIDRIRHYDFTAARSLLERVLESEPTFALGHSQLANVLHVLGYDDRARHEASRALELSGTLTEDEQLDIQARLHGAEKDWGKAATAYATLMARHPDQIEYALGYATALSFGGRGTEAFAVLERLRMLPGESDDARIDLREANAAQAVTDFARELAAADRASQHARERGIDGLLAEAQYYRGDALQSLGRIDEALKTLQHAQKLYQALGDRGGIAYVLTAISDLHARQGDFARAESEQGEALAVFRELGDQVHAAWGLHNLANIHLRRGDRAGAHDIYEQALREFRAYGDQRGIGSCLVDMAGTSIREGDLSGARGMLEQARTIFHDIGHRQNEAIALGELAELDKRRGDLAAARKEVDDALERFRALDDREGIADHLVTQAQLLHLGDDLDGARRVAGDAIKLYTEVKEPTRAITLGVDVADWDLESAPAHAEQVARDGAAKVHGEGHDGQEAGCLAVLAHALTVQKKFDEAATTLRRADELAAGVSDRELKLDLALVSGRLQAARGDRAHARLTIARARGEAHRAGLAESELEAELALAEIDPSRAPALERLARDKGFLAVARRAARIR
jgi:tetratricopeptide (TPR) repeat protein/tRNA A-37 threonylcarbamoyl transferase component Bud32